MLVDSTQAHLRSNNSPKSQSQSLYTTQKLGKELLLALLRIMALGSRNENQVHPDVLLQARQACYKARDAFYVCLEKHSDKKPTEIASVGLLYPADCKKSRADFVHHCRVSWVKHFDRLYCRNRRVQRHLDDEDSRRGPLLLPQPSTFKP